MSKTKNDRARDLVTRLEPHVAATLIWIASTGGVPLLSSTSHPTSREALISVVEQFSPGEKS